MSRELKSKAALSGVITLAVAVVLMGGMMVLATDYTWTGNIADGGLWSEPDNWSPSGVPGEDDTADITNVVENNTCVFDLEEELIIDGLELAGDSPTKMTLHVRDAPLTVHPECVLGDYAQITADQNLTINVDTPISGSIWVQVDDYVTVQLGLCTNVVGNAGSGGVSCILHVNDADYGSCKVPSLMIDAEDGGVARGLKVDATNSAFTVTGTAVLRSEQGSGGTDPTNKGKLWVADGTMSIQSGSQRADFIIDGGPTLTRKAEIDVDGSLKGDATCVQPGYVDIDVADGQVFYAGQYQIGSNAVVHVTGDGRVESGI